MNVVVNSSTLIPDNSGVKIPKGCESFTPFLEKIQQSTAAGLSLDNGIPSRLSLFHPDIFSNNDISELTRSSQFYKPTPISNCHILTLNNKV